MIVLTKVDIFSGFLGAGKTTLIKKLIEEAYAGEKIVLIENEFGEIGVDSGFLKESGVEINEMNSGCICCSLVGDFSVALQQVLDEFSPDRILIEPSGVGKLSDVIAAVRNLHSNQISLNAFTTVVDAKKYKMYKKNFGEFFNNQVENASTVILSHTVGAKVGVIEECISEIRLQNKDAGIISTDWDELTGMKILETMENKRGVAIELEKLKHEHDHCEHNHEHSHDHCEHDHGHKHEEHNQNEHHHEHEGHNHEHHHNEHDDNDHEHHHHADDIFDSIGIETGKIFQGEELKDIIGSFDELQEYGLILRAKGIVEGTDGWKHFDYIPGEFDEREGTPETIGIVCVIGVGLNKDKIEGLFKGKK